MNTVQNKKTRFLDIGLKDYQEAWDYQASLFEQILATKTANRDRSADAQQATDNYLLFCEHPHVFTLGKSGHEENLIIPKEQLSDVHATYYRVNRGGDITYHGPGQIVGYPVIDMENFFTDIHRYMRFMEEAVIQTLREYNIEAGRSPGQTGVWLDPDDFLKARKICALGVRTSRWVTMHGFAFNVNPDLRYFGYIVPCGIQDKAVTSLEQELGKKVDLEEVKQILKEKIRVQFDMEWL
jgi:lipoyl(octanoyl) transferase